MPASAPRGFLETALRRSLEAEVRAFKPGNVSLDSPGHDMTARDFLLSAELCAPILVRPVSDAGADLGARVLEAVRVTRERVGCNTNLGMLLLCAPLALAAVGATQAFPERRLRERLERVLSRQGAEAAAAVFEAIRHAAPGGLGRSERFDVHAGRPPADLIAAMRYAAPRDRIARQYAEGFAEVFELGLPVVRERLRVGATLEWAALCCYLAWLGRFPDTHILRRHGVETARRVRERARELHHRLPGGNIPDHKFTDALREFDRDLKQARVNPGTCADLTAASLFSALLTNRGKPSS